MYSLYVGMIHAHAAVSIKRRLMTDEQSQGRRICRTVARVALKMSWKFLLSFNSTSFVRRSLRPVYRELLYTILWLGGVMVRALAVGLRLERLRLQLSAVPLSGNDLGQVVHTHVSLSPSSIIWYQSQGNDILRLGR